MEDQQNFDDFKNFLQNEVEDIKMYPSDNVWSEISKKIQPKKSWPALTIFAFLLSISLGIATYLNYPPNNALTKISFENKSKTNSLAKEVNTENIFSAKSNTSILKEKNTSYKSLQVLTPYFSEKAKSRKSLNNITISNNHLLLNASINVNRIAKSKKQRNQSERHELTENNRNTIVNHLNSDYSSFKIVPIVGNNQALLVDITQKSKKILIKIGDDNNKSLNLLDSNKVEGNFVTDIISKNKNKLANKLSFEIYATPSISYRRLEDDQLANQYAAMPTTRRNAINQEVSHKRGLGSEIGVGFKYRLTDDIVFKTGIQFNIRQYFMDAYQEKGLATIKTVQNNNLDSSSLQASYSNSSTTSNQIKLDNKLYQISIPIGLEWNAWKGRKLGFNMSASIQPTYSLNRNVYIISTDYKYYTDGTSFFRTWNLNSSLDATVSYQLKKSTIYLGPQVRYQHLPTYNDKYPIKEYRLDYGIKIGIVRPFK